MPVTLVDRLPLPNLKVYTAGSVLLLSVAVYYALSVTSDPNWRANATLQRQGAMGAEGEGEVLGMVQPLAEPTLAAANATRNISDQFVEVMTFMMQEPLCMWVSNVYQLLQRNVIQNITLLLVRSFAKFKLIDQYFLLQYSNVNTELNKNGATPGLGAKSACKL